MGYSVDLRRKVIEYLAEGNTQREASAVFHISLSVVNRRNQLYTKTGKLEDKKPCRSYKKLNPEKLKDYVNEHPDAYLKEIGEVFGCSDTAVMKAFARLGITRKKRRIASVNKGRNK